VALWKQQWIRRADSLTGLSSLCHPLSFSCFAHGIHWVHACSNSQTNYTSISSTLLLRTWEKTPLLFSGGGSDSYRYRKYVLCSIWLAYI
jgi:hypothetical protein